MTRQELTPRQKEIRQWVLDNPKRTENDVVNAMKEKGVCSRVTTLNEIFNLKERQVLEDIRTKPNNFSCLVVRDDNEFNRIYNMVEKIKKDIEAMDEPVKKLLVQRAEFTLNSKTEQVARDGPSLSQLQYNLEFRYMQSRSLMLQFLWDLTNEAIQSEKDKQILHTNIVKLMIKINRQFWNYRNFKNEFKFFTFDQNILRFSLSKKVGVTKELIDKLNATQEDFTKGFLS